MSPMAVTNGALSGLPVCFQLFRSFACPGVRSSSGGRYLFGTPEARSQAGSCGLKASLTANRTRPAQSFCGHLGEGPCRTCSSTMRTNQARNAVDCASFNRGGSGEAAAEAKDAPNASKSPIISEILAAAIPKAPNLYRLAASTGRRPDRTRACPIPA